MRRRSVDGPTSRRARRTLAVALAVAATLSLAACGGSSDTSASPSGGADEFSGYVRRPVRDVGAVSLPSADGTPVSMSPSVPGGVRLVYFGYTSCPDVCPTTMADIAKAVRSLPAARRGEVQVAMVSVDPARDSAAKLSAYVDTFVPGGAALRTDDDAALRAAARAFGADYSVTTGADGQPQVTHTSDVFVVDDSGRVVLAWPYGTSSRSIAADLRRLLAGERPPEIATTSSTTTAPPGSPG